MKCKRLDEVLELLGEHWRNEPDLHVIDAGRRQGLINLADKPQVKIVFIDKSAVADRAV